MNDQTQYEQLVQRFALGGALVRWWPVEGGVSAQVTGLVVRHANGAEQAYLMRRHGAADIASNPNIAEDEFRLLACLQAYNVGAPEPAHLDTSGEVFPTPLLVLKYIQGETIFQPKDVRDFAAHLAQRLARIHQIPNAAQTFDFLPSQAESDAHFLAAAPLTVDEAMLEGEIRQALRATWPPAQRNASVLLHGDYWPGNILWRDGRIVGVIDWENAALGDPLSDVARARMELCWSLGEDAMIAFTAAYRTLASTLDYTHLYQYDLVAALRPIHKIAGWGLDEVNEQRIRRQHITFVQQALAQR